MDEIFVFEPRESDQGKDLYEKWKYYAGTQHDHLLSTWDGCNRSPGVDYLREKYHVAGFVIGRDDIPAAVRKPDVALPLGGQIVGRFTGMLVGDRTSAQVVAAGDEPTTAYLAQVDDTGGFASVWSEARNVAGATGCALIACALLEGQPNAEVLKPFDCIPIAWKYQRQKWQLSDVIEQRLVSVRKVKDGKLVTENEWETRRWTDKVVIRYQNVPEKWAKDKPIPIAEGGAINHGLARCPVVWYQNVRDTESPYSRPDLEGTYHLLDKIDRLESQTTKATTANVDPTLHIADVRSARHPFIKKGAAIRTSEVGKVTYVEISGDSIEAGMKKTTDLRRQVENKTECIIIDPETGSWAYRSGEALQVLMRSMQSRAGTLRITLGQAHVEVARMYVAWGESVKLPPRAIVDVEKVKEGADVEKVKLVPHKLGSADPVLTVSWPPFWTPTATQLQQIVSALSTATAAGKVLSIRTATEELSRQIGTDPVVELGRLAAEREEAMEQQDRILEKTAGFDDKDSDEDPLGKKPKPADDDDDEPTPKKKPKKGAAKKKAEVA